MKTPGKTLCSLLLIIAAIVWGISFVTQSIGGQLLGAYSFNAARMLLGSLIILIVTRSFGDMKGLSSRPEKGQMTRKQVLVGIICGIFLTIGTNLQQVALNMGTSTGKAGFITAFYIILVPIFSLFFRQKAGWNIWIAVIIALAGLYFLCINGEFVFGSADLMLLGCAAGFACQIITIDRYGKGLDGLRLAGMEFLTCGILSAIMAVIWEIIPYDGGFTAWLGLFRSGNLWISLLYMGIFSCGVGYSFQILGQQNLDPTIASILMSLEAVFSALAGWAFMGQILSARELAGCALMFAAVILAQVNFSRKGL